MTITIKLKINEFIFNFLYTSLNWIEVGRFHLFTFDLLYETELISHPLVILYKNTRDPERDPIKSIIET